MDKSSRLYAEPVGGHAPLGRALRAVLFLVPALVFGGVLHLGVGLDAPLGVTLLVAVLVLWAIFTSGVRIAAQWERGVVLRLGRFFRAKGPGMFYAVPFIDFVRFIDMRILTLNIPSQRVITKDNVPASIDGVLFFAVTSAEDAVIKIQDYQFAIAQYAQASLRDVVGGLSLDDLLSERQHIAKQLEDIVKEHIKDWGVEVDSIRLLDIEMPEELKKMMSRQASAEREKRATITKAEGDKLAAANLAEAATIMQKTPGAMQLRMLQTIDGLGPNPANTVIFFPTDLSDVARIVAKVAPSAYSG